MRFKEDPQHDDHCIIVYQGEPWRIVSAHKGMYEIRALQFCRGCGEHHEDFAILDKRWCKEYADQRNHIITHFYCDDVGDVHPLH